MLIVGPREGIKKEEAHGLTLSSGQHFNRRDRMALKKDGQFGRKKNHEINSGIKKIQKFLFEQDF